MLVFKGNVYKWIDYSKCIHRPETIRHLAESYLNNLRSYLQQSPNHQSSFYTSSDFSLVDLSETELDSILQDLEDPEEILL